MAPLTLPVMHNPAQFSPAWGLGRAAKEALASGRYRKRCRGQEAREQELVVDGRHGRAARRTGFDLPEALT